MNRKSGSNNGGGVRSKRRRSNGGGGSCGLAEKTMGRDDGYGYPSSDSDDDTVGTNRSSSGKAKAQQQRRARKEQQMGVRSFCTAKESSKGNDDDDDDESNTGQKESASLPTPKGWAQLSQQNNAAISSRVKTPRPPTDVSKSSGFTLSSAPRKNNGSANNKNAASSKNNNNPYASKMPMKTPAAKGNTTNTNAYTSSSTDPSATRTSRSTNKPRSTHHVVCAVSENLARETCVAYMDAGRPTYLHITKQGNGQTYAETMSFLRMLHPDEVLLNEGRRNSQLATKILALFSQDLEGVDNTMVAANKILFGNGNGGKKKKNGKNGGRGRKERFANRGGKKGGGDGNDAGDDNLTSANLSSACETTTVVKFVPRSYFDQTKGAELLRKLAREDTYDASLVEEYILLSSSYAVLQYAQLCLGAGLTRGSLALDVNVGGNHRMNIDRSTMVNLELLVNAKTGRTANSLVGSIDCTKTSVGGRLLRTNLMAPPTRLDTINARLDLIDSLLEDEEFFYVVMECFEALPDVDKMLSYIALAPRKRSIDNSGNGALFGNVQPQAVTARIASKGISALVCIKSTLSVIPRFAHVLEVQLKELDERDRVSSSSGVAAAAAAAAAQRKNPVERSMQRERSGSLDDDESTTVVESETSRNEDDTVDYDTRNDTAIGYKTPSTQHSSLQIGLGTNSSSPNNDNTARVPPRHQLLRAILIAMKQPALSRVLDAVTDIFTESTTYIKSSHAMRHQECFALKPNTDGMMDVLRKAFLANVDDIYRLADEYAETYDINVQVKETTSRGYYLSVPADLGLDLPQIFIQPVKNGRFIHCTTEEVYSLNSRSQENVQDLLLMTHGRIQEVLQVARDNYDCIASLSDAIALLDMCHCFADNVASSRLSWCRPVLSDRDRDSGQDHGSSRGGGGAIAIRNGRYAIDVSSTGVGSSSTNGDFVPNDTYSSALQNFTVITGINGSGKSTYLKQIALIVILAHCGSYVPADEAMLPIRDQICTRIGTADDQEHNISTFLLEMKETAMICNSTTDRSLFLLDELGRATSNEDGVAVAWAVSEYLLTKRAMTFFVTHYPQLSKLSDVYSNVQNQHLGSQISPSSNGSSINYTHKIMPGPCKAAGDYGVEMASTCGWPEDAVRNARRIRQEVKRLMPGEDVCYNENCQHNDNFAENKRKAHNILCDIAKHLAAMKEGEGRLSKEAKKNYLQDLRERLVPTNDESLVKMIRSLLLNADDNMPAIPLNIPKPVASNGRRTKELAPKDTSGAPQEEEMNALVSNRRREPPEKMGETIPLNQWNCESSSDDDDSAASPMDVDRPLSDPTESNVPPKKSMLEPDLPQKDSSLKTTIDLPPIKDAPQTKLAVPLEYPVQSSVVKDRIVHKRDPLLPSPGNGSGKQKEDTPLEPPHMPSFRGACADSNESSLHKRRKSESETSTASSSSSSSDDDDSESSSSSSSTSNSSSSDSSSSSSSNSERS